MRFLKFPIGSYHEETECACGCPLYVGDFGFFLGSDDSRAFCSPDCVPLPDWESGQLTAITICSESY